jgi:predicted DNA-binding WGR domain protein
MEATGVTLFKEAPEANMRRQYSIEVVRDLFGANVVVCRWGRIGAHGQRREHVWASRRSAGVRHKARS